MTNNGNGIVAPRISAWIETIQERVRSEEEARLAEQMRNAQVNKVTELQVARRSLTEILVAAGIVDGEDQWISTIQDTETGCYIQITPTLKLCVLRGAGEQIQMGVAVPDDLLANEAWLVDFRNRREAGYLYTDAERRRKRDEARQLYQLVQTASDMNARMSILVSRAKAEERAFEMYKKHGRYIVTGEAQLAQCVAAGYRVTSVYMGDKEPLWAMEHLRADEYDVAIRIQGEAEIKKRALRSVIVSGVQMDRE